jgi:hypothetical protein
MISNVTNASSPTSVDTASQTANTDVVSMTPDALLSFCTDSLAGVETGITQAMQTAKANPGDATALLDLQSRVAQRQEIVDLTSNLIAAYNRSAESTIGNIGH